MEDFLVVLADSTQGHKRCDAIDRLSEILQDTAEVEQGEINDDSQGISRLSFLLHDPDPRVRSVV